MIGVVVRTTGMSDFAQDVFPLGRRGLGDGGAETDGWMEDEGYN